MGNMNATYQLTLATILKVIRTWQSIYVDTYQPFNPMET